MISRMTSLVFILIITVITVVDSGLVDFSSYSGFVAPISMYTIFFLIFFVAYVVVSSILLNSCFKIIPSNEVGITFVGVRYFRGTVVATQFLIVGIMLIIALQMLLLNEYSLVLLRVETYLTHISAAVLISFLTFLLLGWLMTKRNYAVMLYSISFLLVAFSIMVALIYLEVYLSNVSRTEIRWYPIISYITNLNPTSAFVTEPLSNVFDILTLASFLAMWIATAALLKEYQHRLGRFRFFFLMSLPLIYYIYPFQSYFGDIIFSTIQSSPVLISTFYILIFSATRQVGALLFSLALWTASSLVFETRVRQSLLISAIGMSALFSSVELSAVKYHTYPPFGLITEAFLPLGACLLSVGIYASAKKVSQDALLRREFYKSASSQLALLKAIGVSQMEREFQDRIKSVKDYVSTVENVQEESLSEENAKEILREVLSELYSSEPEKDQQQS